MIKFTFILLALILETSSIFTILKNDNSNWILFFYLLQHGVASLFLALAGWYFIDEKHRQPRALITLLLFNLSFFIPMLGLPSVFLAILISAYRRPVRIAQPFSSLVMPEFVLSIRETEIKFSQGGIKSRLAHSATPAPQRLKSLFALQGMPARVSSPLLQDMLGDSSDDIRLVAYGLLDSPQCGK